MALSPISKVSGRGVVVPGADIDTDRIIPARFMKCVTFDGLGEYAFYDVRFDPESGEPTDHPLNDERFAGASVLVAGVNFGCGSSREHAPQSLYRYGFRAVVAESFAEIFFGNSTTLGFPCVCAKAADLERLGELVKADPSVEIEIDLQAMTLRAGDFEAGIEMPASAREALLSGRHDPLQELLENAEAVERTAGKLSYV